MAMVYLVDAQGRLIVVPPSPSILAPINKASAFSVVLPAGASSQVAYTVPAGETWRLTTVAMQYVGVVAGVAMRLYAWDGALSMVINRVAPPVNQQPYITQMNGLFSPGWQLKCDISGATAGDQLGVYWFAERIN